MIGRNDPCWCGSKKKWKKCHYPSRGGKSALSAREKYKKQYGILIKTPEEIDGIRRSGHLAAHILNTLCKEAKEGVTTARLDQIARELHREAGAIPAPLGYGTPPFPKSICTSLNDVICHGIPDERPLQDGDILNIDVTCILDGFYGDCSQMVAIGTPSDEKKRVVEASLQGLKAATKILAPGVPLSAIGKEIEEVADRMNCSVVEQFVGHGVGRHFHEEPQIPHYESSVQTPLIEGMTFTIEPMINAGRKEAVIDPEDQWTARTVDGRPSAQWEYTFLITESGYEVLTPWG